MYICVYSKIQFFHRDHHYWSIYYSYIHTVVTNRNKNSNEIIYTSYRIDDNLGGTMSRFRVSYNDSFIQDLQPNAIYLFTVSTQNDAIEIARPNAPPSCGK